MTAKDDAAVRRFFEKIVRDVLREALHGAMRQALRDVVPELLPAPAPTPPPRPTVISLSDFADQVGISPQTLRRLIKRGDGPPLIRLSSRIYGVRLSDGEAWLESRKRYRPIL